MNQQPFVELGRISGIYGVRGWVRVFSWTQPREQILKFPSWRLGPGASQPSADLLQPAQLEDGRVHGKGIVAKLAGVDDRDRAAELIDYGIFVSRAELPEPESGVYYWADLIGLSVCDAKGRALGVVDHLMETGAHDVLVLSGGTSQMIPFVLDKVVLGVDLTERVITVQWDPAWWE